MSRSNAIHKGTPPNKRRKLFYNLKKILACFYAGTLTILAPLYRFVFNLSNKSSQRGGGKRIVLLVSRPQDVDLLIGLHENARSRENLSLYFWVTKNCARKYPEALRKLEEKNTVVDQVVNFIHLGRILNKLMRIDAFLSTVESTTAKGKLPYMITRLANAASVPTYTLQHGFENVGLSYCDKAHGPDVKFAAKTVLTWGPVNELPPWVAKETLDKAVAVGCPSILRASDNSPKVEAGERPMIAVFDNLHWNRYNQKYVSIFLRHLEEIAEQWKDFRFVLKSHPASVRSRSRELTDRLSEIKNLDVVDMLGERGEKLTTPWLLSHALGVITTPSTIALDGAMAKVPVAVARYGHDLSYYSPLYMLDKLEDWQIYLGQLTGDSEYQILKQSGERFLSRVLVPGNPADKILNLIVRQ